MKFNPLCIIVVLTGAYLLVKLRFFFILHPFRTLGLALRGVGRRDTARSLFLALSGTLGVGNIFGVAVGLITGGAGSVLWMLVSSLFASVLKYSEVVLSTDSASRDEGGSHGGMFASIRRTLGKIPALVYTVATLLLSLMMGAALQSAALVTSVGQIFNTPPTLTAVVLAFFVLFAIVGGTKIIERVTAVIIPLTTIVYIILTVLVILVCRERLPEVLRAILAGAFSARGFFGGALGFLFSRAVSEGFARGLLSNEAGAGTSSMAHARASTLNPAAAGLMGIVEVFFDTVLLCTLTALAILTSVGDISAFSSGMPLVITAVTSALGAPVASVLAFCVVAFAYSTVICWYFYGTEALAALFGKTPSRAFLPIYLALVVLGTRLPEGVLVLITDTLLLIMTLTVAILLIKNSDRIRTLSENGGVINKRREKYSFARRRSRRGRLK